jgi:hypothetical protein
MRLKFITPTPSMYHFPDFLGPNCYTPGLFQVLESKLKFQDFSAIPGPIGTLGSLLVVTYYITVTPS